MFVVDVSKEYIAVREAQRLNIPLFAIVDTNSDPSNIDFPIPANDDASKSISLIIDKVTDAIKEGLEERKMEKEKEGGAKEKQKSARKPAGDAKKSSARKSKNEGEEKKEVENREAKAEKDNAEAAETKNENNEAEETKKETKE